MAQVKKIILKQPEGGKQNDSALQMHVLTLQILLHENRKQSVVRVL